MSEIERPAARLDLGVGVAERQAERVGEPAADAGLADAHQADEGDGAPRRAGSRLTAASSGRLAAPARARRAGARGRRGVCWERIHGRVPRFTRSGALVAPQSSPRPACARSPLSARRAAAGRSANGVRRAPTVAGRRAAGARRTCSRLRRQDAATCPPTSGAGPPRTARATDCLPASRTKPPLSPAAAALARRVLAIRAPRAGAAPAMTPTLAGARAQALLAPGRPGRGADDISRGPAWNPRGPRRGPRPRRALIAGDDDRRLRHRRRAAAEPRRAATGCSCAAYCQARAGQRRRRPADLRS